MAGEVTCISDARYSTALLAFRFIAGIDTGNSIYGFPSSADTSSLDGNSEDRYFTKQPMAHRGIIPLKDLERRNPQIDAFAA